MSEVADFCAQRYLIESQHIMIFCNINIFRITRKSYVLIIFKT